MNLKKLLLSIILATFIQATATSYANEDSDDTVGYCEEINAFDDKMQTALRTCTHFNEDIAIINPAIKEFCQKKYKEICDQNVVTQKKIVEDIVNKLSLTNPKSVVWFWNKSNITKDPLNMLMTYYTLQYDQLINILNKLTGGVCSGFNEELLLIKDMLTSDYNTCYETAKSGNSGINCLAKFHGGLLSTANMLYLIVDGMTLKELVDHTMIICGKFDETEQTETKTEEITEQTVESEI